MKNTRDSLIYRPATMLFLIAISLMATYVQPTRTAQSAEVSVGVAFVNARVAPLWVADKEGFFKKNGIETKILKLAGGTQGAQAMLSGGIDIGYTDPTSMVAAIAGGAQLTEIMFG